MELEQQFKSKLGLSETLNRQKPTSRPTRNAETEKNEWRKKSMEFRKKGSITKMFVSAKRHVCKLPLDKLKPISLNEMQVPMLHEGKYLICRSIVNPFAMVATITLVEDFKGDVEEVFLYNFSYNLESSSWLKPDAIMVIKEPYLCQNEFSKNVCIRVDSPSDVIFVDPTNSEFLQKIGASKWIVSMTRDVEEIRKMGNDNFIKKDYDEAIRLYDRAICYNPKLPILYLNKASAYLRSENYQLAYQAAKFGMEKGGDREKALHRMGLAAYGMRNWKSAVEHFKLLSKEFPKNSDAKTELKRSLKRLDEENTGKFDFKQMYLESNKGKRAFDVSDYIIPSIKVAPIPGKGRGVVATEDIPKGALLLVHKAFAAGYPNDVSPTLMSPIEKQVVNLATKLQVIRAVDNLRKNPKMTKNVYNLYSGNSVQNVNIPEGVIDVELIEKVSVQNHFGGASFDDNEVLLFLFPSYFNHSCIANTHKTFYGDIMVVHANTNIKKGDEITTIYTQWLDSYSTRKKKLIPRGFECNCRRCLIESVGEENQLKRANLFKQLETLSKLPPHRLGQAIKDGNVILKQIENSYGEQKTLKLDLVKAWSTMSGMYFDVNNIGSSIECMEKAIELTDDEFEYVMDVPVYWINIAYCYVTLNQKQKARKFMDKAIEISFCENKEHFKLLYPQARELFDVL